MADDEAEDQEGITVHDPFLQLGQLHSENLQVSHLSEDGDNATSDRVKAREKGRGEAHNPFSIWQKAQ